MPIKTEPIYSTSPTFHMPIMTSSLKTKSDHDTNVFVVVGGTGGCHDNLRRRQECQIWYHGNFRFLMDCRVAKQN